LRAQIDGLANEYIAASSAADMAADKIRDVQEASQRGAQSIASVFEGVASGALSAEQAVGQLIVQILKMALQKRLMEAADGGGWFGKIASVIGGGFAEGGYTGNGGKYEPAGVVHKGEYVMSKSATSAIGVGNLAALHSHAVRGYANGGLVAMGAASASTARSGGTGDTSNPITINAPITIEGSAGTPDQNADLAKQISKSIEQSMRGTVVAELQRQMRPGNMLNSGKR
jgi:phage-related minor tail protein